MAMLSRQESKTKKVAYFGMLTALAMVLSYVESRIPMNGIVPGMKLGLTNLVVLVALYRIGWREAALLNFVRILLVALTFGSMFSFFYSFAGGILSFLVMLGGKEIGRFHVVTVSVMGGIFHNVGQIMVAMFVLETLAVGYYLWVLWMTGIIAGAVIGILGGVLIRALPKKI